MKKLNRRQAIRARCIDCSGFVTSDVRHCEITDCFLYPFRMGTGKQDAKARDQAIKNYCRIHCMMGQQKEVTLCPSIDCPLFLYRKYGDTSPETAI